MKGSRKSYSGRLDFADPIQYRYFMRRLTLSGVTADKFPQLYRSLAETRARHLAGGKMASLNDPGCPPDTICPVNILTTFGAPTTNPQNFTVSAFSSIPNNPSVVMNSIELTDQNNNLFAGPQNSTDYKGGYDVVTILNGTAPSTATQIIAQGTWYYVPQGGGGVPGYFYADTVQGQQPTIINTSPTNVKGNQQIKVCVTRQDADCDYWYAAQPGGQNVVQFPLSGNVTYPNAIKVNSSNQPLDATSSVIISQPNQQQGGGCTPLPINQTFVNYTNVSGNVVSWDVNPASFGVATPCFPSNSTVVFDLMLTVYDVNNHSQIIAITSQQGVPQSNTLRIFPMIVVYGCVAEGTLVTMADGSEKAIQTIRAGELIQSNPARVPLTVDNYTKGFEKQPMYLITTENKRELLLTEGHPVVTVGGVKAAKRLVVGDVLITNRGHSRLVKIVPKKFDGNIWNLDVGRPNDRVRLTDNNTTFYANGILVGDGQMQKRFDRADYESPAQVLKRIDKKWHIDYRNSELMSKERRRKGQ